MASEHYDLGSWADFARDLVGGRERQGMRRHLDDGCRRCARRLETVRRLEVGARRDAEATAPAAALRLAKGIAALVARDARSEMGLGDLVLRLVFDTLHGPLPAGARQEAASDRQLVFESERCMLHVYLEPPAGDGSYWLAGQLLDGDSKPLSGVPACLLSETRVASFVVTNEAGEFQLTAPGLAGSELRFLMTDGLRVTVELPSA